MTLYHTTMAYSFSGKLCFVHLVRFSMEVLGLYVSATDYTYICSKRLNWSGGRRCPLTLYPNTKSQL